MKVSVIVPVYNVENYLEKCLDSLVNQTLKNIEIIVVNDGTKDDSQKIIDRYTKIYSNIKSYKKENGGISSARNFGISKSSGDYIGFVDSDDYIDKTMYEKLYNKIVSEDYDIVLCDLYRVYGERLVYTSSNTKDDLSNKDLVKNSMLNFYPTVWNKLYKKALFDELKFKEKVWFEDVELLYRLYSKINKIGVVKEPLYYYVQRQGSITSSVNNKIYDYIDNMNSVIDYYKINNIYNEYKGILEFVYVRYIYATFIKRVLNFPKKEYLKALDLAIKNVNNNFRNYRKNKLFYKSIKGIYLICFNRFLGLIMYNLKR